MDLKKIESGLKRLVESQLVRALRGNKPEDRVLQRLMEELGASTRTDQMGRRVAPNSYTIMVRPGAAEFWQKRLSSPELLDAIREMAAQSGVRLTSPPTISVVEDPHENREGEFNVVAAFQDAPVNETQDLTSHTPPHDGTTEGQSPPPNAFLIVDGATQYALSQAVVNVGRRLDNHLVIEDPRVSRHHAQLRAIHGCYVLFDLNSSGGSFVNGQRTSQSVLRPGDVISLAGVTLIYAQDSSHTEQQLAATAPHGVSGERPTVVGKHEHDAGTLKP
jgi:pSer/pThr/pTyr-binding forkhead associated (FHA) protein